VAVLSTSEQLRRWLSLADWYGAHGEGGDPGVGGPFPDMCIAGIAIDRAHKGNGCLQMCDLAFHLDTPVRRFVDASVLCDRMRGSHKMGRLDSHQEEWGERHIHPRRIELAIKAGCEPVFCEQEPGDCLFFHCECRPIVEPRSPARSIQEIVTYAIHGQRAVRVETCLPVGVQAT
jgi:hypothetical protein